VQRSESEAFDLERGIDERRGDQEHVDPFQDVAVVESPRSRIGRAMSWRLISKPMDTGLSLSGRTGKSFWAKRFTGASWKSRKKSKSNIVDIFRKPEDVPPVVEEAISKEDESQLDAGRGRQPARQGTPKGRP